MNVDNRPGVILGAIFGAYDELATIISQMGSSSWEWEPFVKMSIYAFVGGMVGWLGSEMMSSIKKKYKKWKNDKSN